MLHPIRNFTCDDREYFSGDRQEIARRNGSMLIDACVLYAAVLAFYTILTTITFEAQILRTMYYVFDAALYRAKRAGKGCSVVAN